MNFRVDFMSMPLYIRKARFRQFQLLALSKGIIWGSGRYTPYPVRRLQDFHPSMVSIQLERSTHRMLSSSNKNIPIIDIKEAIKLLQEYKVNETTKVDQGTVQDTYASTTATSYTIPSSLPGLVRANAGVDWGI